MIIAAGIASALPPRWRALFSVQTVSLACTRCYQTYLHAQPVGRCYALGRFGGSRLLVCRSPGSLFECYLIFANAASRRRCWLVRQPATVQVRLPSLDTARLLTPKFNQ